MNVSADIDAETLPWFAVRVRSRFEKPVAAALESKGCGVLLPLFTSRRAWSDRIKEVELPLFPGYVFSRFDPNRRLPILITPGVISIVGVGRTPVPIAAPEIAAVMAIVNCGRPAERWAYLQVGEMVQIRRGPLRGLEGIVVRCGKGDKLIVSVTLLQRSIAVGIDREWTVPGVSAGDTQHWSRTMQAIPLRAANCAS